MVEIDSKGLQTSLRWMKVSESHLAQHSWDIAARKSSAMEQHCLKLLAGEAHVALYLVDSSLYHVALVASPATALHYEVVDLLGYVRTVKA